MEIRVQDDRVAGWLLYRVFWWLGVRYQRNNVIGVAVVAALAGAAITPRLGLGLLIVGLAYLVLNCSFWTWRRQRQYTRTMRGHDRYWLVSDDAPTWVIDSGSQTRVSFADVARVRRGRFGFVVWLRSGGFVHLPFVGFRSDQDKAAVQSLFSARGWM